MVKVPRQYKKPLVTFLVAGVAAVIGAHALEPMLKKKI